jgi:hypothetical protein
MAAGIHSTDTSLMRRFIAPAIAVLLLASLSVTPAGARYGFRYRVYARISSGNSGWETSLDHDGTFAVVTRSVHPGRGVVFDIRARGEGHAVASPFVRGCDSAPGFEVRYILIRKVRPDENITNEVQNGGWEEMKTSGQDWHLHVRLAVRVGAGVHVGTSDGCRVNINWARLRAVTVAS